MGLNDEIQKFKKNLRKLAQSQVMVQTSWVKVKSVDWDKKTMVATGIIDGLDYHDVLLGLGSEYIKPKVGTLCKIGKVENKDAASYVISTEEAELMLLDSLEIILNGGENGGLIIIAELVNRINILEKDNNKLKQAFVSWTFVAQDGGAALRTAVVGAPAGPAVPGSWAADTLTETKTEDIENPKVKH